MKVKDINLGILGEVRLHELEEPYYVPDHDITVTYRGYAEHGARVCLYLSTNPLVTHPFIEYSTLLINEEHV